MSAPDLTLLDAELDVALERRVKAHQDRKADALSVRDYLRILREAREVEDRIEPKRRAAGATTSRAFDVALEEYPELRERVAEPCEFCGADCELGVCPKSIVCPTCRAKPGQRCRRPSEHSGPMVAIHATRIEAAELPGPPVLRPEPFKAHQERASVPLAPLPQQLDLDGGLHDLAPQTRQERLFEPAPTQLAGQTSMAAEAAPPTNEGDATQ